MFSAAEEISTSFDINNDNAASLVSGISSQLSAITFQTTDSSSLEAINLRAQSHLSMQSLDLLAVGLTNNKLDKITDEQSSAIVFAIDRLYRDNPDEANETDAKDLKILTDRLNGAFEDIAYSSDYPRVYSFEPAVVVLSEDPTKKYQFKVIGVNLEGSNPSLFFRSKSCDLVNKSKNELLFECNLSFLLNSSIIRTSSNQDIPTPAYNLSGNLIIYEETPKYFGLSNNYNPINLDLITTIMPSQLGSYRLETKTNIEKQSVRHKTKSFSHRNSHCEGSRKIDWSVRADITGGWFIDETSIKTDVNARSGSRLLSVNPSPEKILITALVANSGACGPKVFGERVGYDARGKLSVTVNWNEIRAENVTSTEQVESGKLMWGQSKRVFFPEQADEFILHISKNDNSELYITSAGEYDWVNVVFDADSNALVITPKPILDALASN